MADQEDKFPHTPDGFIEKGRWQYRQNNQVGALLSWEQAKSMGSTNSNLDMWISKTKNKMDSLKALGLEPGSVNVPVNPMSTDTPAASTDLIDPIRKWYLGYALTSGIKTATKPFVDLFSKIVPGESFPASPAQPVSPTLMGKAVTPQSLHYLLTLLSALHPLQPETPTKQQGWTDYSGRKISESTDPGEDIFNSGL